MTIHWKALEEHFLISFQTFSGEKCIFLNFVFEEELTSVHDIISGLICKHFNSIAVVLSGIQNGIDHVDPVVVNTKIIVQKRNAGLEHFAVAARVS
jgi:hypothetical protein